MVQAMVQLVYFPSYLLGLPMRHALWFLMSPHGAQLRLMIMVYTLVVDRVNGDIVTQNVLVMVQTVLSEQAMKVKVDKSIRGFCIYL